MDQLALDHYAKLSMAEIKTLVVDDRWLARLAADLQSELDRVGQIFDRAHQRTSRTLNATPLPQLVNDVAVLSARVEEHLKLMGAGMEVKPGYKQTEMEVITENWSIYSLAELC